MIPFPSQKAPDLAAWADAWMQEVRQLSVPQGPTPLWSCQGGDLPPAENHPNSAVEIEESGAIFVSSLAGGLWTWVDVADVGGASRDNYLINGDGFFCQRFTPDTLQDRPIGYPFADRWRSNMQLASANIRRVLDPAYGGPFAGQQSLLRIVQKQSGPGRIGFSQWVEFLESRKLRGKTVTFQGKVASNVAVVVKFAVLQWAGTLDVTPNPHNNWNSTTYTGGNFFTAGYAVAGMGSVTLAAGAPQDFSLTCALPTSGFNNIVVAVWTELVGQTGYLDFGGAMLTVGARPRPWRPYRFDAEFRRCQRFYEKSYQQDVPPGTSTGDGVAITQRVSTGGVGVGSVPYLVEKVKPPPQWTFWTVTGTVLSGASTAATVRNFRLYTDFGGIGMQPDYLEFHWAVDADTL